MEFMKPDGTDSLPMDCGSECTSTISLLAEPDMYPGSEVEVCTPNEPPAWSYLFMHHSKVKRFEQLLLREHLAFFVHRTVRYFRKIDRQKVQHQEVPTVSGLIFIQGSPQDIQTLFDRYFLDIHLCKDCSTGRVARIPDSQMQPFMRLNAAAPERIRFLLRPFYYYARNRVLLRITSGELAGLEGYVIRIDRDRRLVMDVGGMSVAISGVHAEKFEEVESDVHLARPTDIFYKRNLQERQALIDRFFHPVKNQLDAQAQAENIDYLRTYILGEMAQGRINTREAWDTFSFIIEEIGYYYAPCVDKLHSVLTPIMQMGGRVLQELERIIMSPQLADDARIKYEAWHQELMSKYEYLF